MTNDFVPPMPARTSSTSNNSTKPLETHSGFFPLRPNPVAASRVAPTSQLPISPASRSSAYEFVERERRVENNSVPQPLRLSYAPRTLQGSQHPVRSPLDSRVSGMKSMGTLRERLKERNFEVNSANVKHKVNKEKRGGKRRKRALLIYLSNTAINNVKTLPNASRDVIALYDLLNVELGYDRTNIWVLSDEEKTFAGSIHYYATRENIENAIEWFVTGLGTGDELFLYFYGDTVPRKNGAGRREWSLVCSDFPSKKPIVGGDLMMWLINELPYGVTLTALLDCKASEKVLPLPFMHSIVRGRRRKFSLEEELDVDDDNLVPIGSNVPGGVVIESMLRVTGIKKGENDLRRMEALEKRNTLALEMQYSGTFVCIGASAETVLDPVKAYRKTKTPGILTKSFIKFVSEVVKERRIKCTWRMMMTEMAVWMASNREIRLPMMRVSCDISPDTEIGMLQRHK